MTTTEGKYKVGDIVLLSDGYSRIGPEEVPIVKVGRSLFYIKRYGREWAFYIENGSERRGPNSVGSAAQVHTFQEWAARERRSEVRKRLKDLHKIEPAGYGDFSQSTEVLEKILALLESEV